MFPRARSESIDVAELSDTLVRRGRRRSMSNWKTIRSKTGKYLVVGALCAASGCAAALDLPDSPTLVVEDNALSCASSSVTRVAPVRDKATVRVHACDFISTNCSATVTSLTASLCDKRDVNCSTPIQSGLHDINGDFAFDVATGGALGVGFDGYLEIKAPTGLCSDPKLFTAPDHMACALAPNCDPTQPDNKNCTVPTYLPSVLFFNPPVTTDLTSPISVPLIPSVASLALLSAAGSPMANSDAGFVFVTVLDCTGKPASGISVGLANSPGTPIATLYLAGGVISATATSTDVSGVGGLLGVPAGFSEVVARAADSATSEPIARVGIQVLPGSVTYVTLVPGK